MKQIQINKFFSTGIHSEYNSINTIEIENTPFGGGNFGEVYNCISINGNAINTPQVVKVYKESYPGSADDNAETIIRLQNKLKSLHYDLKGIGKNIFKEFPAFKGVPQFSFEGVLNGKQIKGFSADNLINLGFEEFEKILSNPKLLDKFYDIPIERKIYFAFQLASAFKKLDEFKYIHADLKEGAIFLNLNTHELAIIDYDSGVITENSNDKPSTWGAIGDWVAPEIYEQLGKIKHGEKVNVDIFTDRWSVAIGINYLISGIHPTFFLKNQGNVYYPMYFENNNKWPNVDTNADYMKTNSASMYSQYLNFLNTQIPPQIKEKMANTINFGYKNPVARTSYHEWESVLQSIQKPPVVKFLTVTKKEILSGESIILSWSSENTISVEIEGYGIYSSIDKKIIKPSNSSTYKVIFKGYYGVITEEISIFVTPSPVFKTLFSDLYKLKKGESTILNWEIENISDAKLSGVKKDSLTISKKGQQIIKPEQSTSYKFQFTALDGKTIIEKFICVEVFEEGVISFFKSDRHYIYPTMPVTLSWEVLNAIKVEIEGEGEFQLTGKLVVYPDKDSLYKIKVTDNFGVIERIISVKMLPLPVIQNLVIPFPSLQSKTNITVNIPTFQEQSIPKFNTEKQSTFKSKINLNSLKQIELNQKLNLSIDLTEISFLARAKNLYKTLIIEYKKAYEKK